MLLAACLISCGEVSMDDNYYVHPERSSSSAAQITGGNIIFSEKWLALADSLEKWQPQEEEKIWHKFFNDFCNAIERVYKEYESLTGMFPQTGKQIFIDLEFEDSSVKHVIEGHNAHAHVEKSLICFSESAAVSLFSDLYNGRNSSTVDFTTAHEIAHIFDNNAVWKFDAESMANIKIAYIAEQTDIKLIDQGQNLNIQYFSMKLRGVTNAYKSGEINKFEHKNSRSESAYDLYNFGLLEQTGWEPFKQAFRDFHNPSAEIRNLPDEQRAVAFWDKVMKADGRGRELLKMLPDGGKLFLDVEKQMGNVKLSKPAIRSDEELIIWD